MELKDTALENKYPMDAQTPVNISDKVVDPSVLTTQQLWREVAVLKELLNNRIEAVEKAVKVSHDDYVRVPTDVQKYVGALERLHEEKFNSVEKQFKERDTRVYQTATDTKLAVDAALQAAEKAVGKSEASTVKQIDAQSLLISNTAKSLDGKIDDVKDRLTRIEGQGMGRQEQGRASKDVWGYVAGGIGLLITIITVLMTIMRNYKS